MYFFIIYLLYILIIYFDFEVSHGITLFVSFLDKHGQIDRQRDREICGLFSWVCMFFMAIVGIRSGVSRKSRCAKSKNPHIYHMNSYMVCVSCQRLQCNEILDDSVLHYWR